MNVVLLGGALFLLAGICGVIYAVYHVYRRWRSKAKMPSNLPALLSEQKRYDDL